MTKPTLDQVLKSYERTLVAKVQLNEYGGWGGSFMSTFRARIAKHEELERCYIEALQEERRTR
jgi:hypothetical protein